MSKKPVPNDHPLKNFYLAGRRSDLDATFRPKLANIKKRIDAVQYRRELAALEKMTGVDYGY